MSRALQPLLTFLFAFVAVWIISSLVVKPHHFFVPLALMQTGLIIGAISVSPFIYGAFFLQFVVLLALPILWVRKKNAGDGLLRFLFYHMLGLVFLAFGGWLARAVDLNPSDTFLMLRAVVIILLGFLFWLALFPFHNWFLMVMNEGSPIVTGFTLGLLRFSALFILLSFLKEYLWLRTFETLFVSLKIIGIIMLVFGGLWGLFQQSAQRTFACLLIAENGLSLFLIGLKTDQSLHVLLTMMFLRLIAGWVWALAIKIISPDDPLQFAALRGGAFRNPVPGLGLVASFFSLAGFPFFPSFPLFARLIQQSFQSAAFWGSAISVGWWMLLLAGFRLAHVLISAPEDAAPGVSVSGRQNLMLGIGTVLLIATALFPGAINQFVDRTQAYFQAITVLQ